jgi:hypothetical protein
VTDGEKFQTICKGATGLSRLLKYPPPSLLG